MRLLLLLLIFAILLTFALAGAWRFGRWFGRMKRRLQARYPWLQGRRYEEEEADDGEDEGSDDFNTVTYVKRPKK